MVGTIAIAKTRPFEIVHSKSPVIKCFRISNGRISDPHCIKKSGIFMISLRSFFQNHSMLNESITLAACLLNIVRTFHGVSKNAADDTKTSTFAICNMFVDENGTVAVEKTLQLSVAAVLDGNDDFVPGLKLLLRELGKFLSMLGVCEVELSDSTTCSKRSVQCLTSLHVTLAKLTRELTGNGSAFKTLFESALDALDLSENVPCLHPVSFYE